MRAAIILLCLSAPAFAQQTLPLRHQPLPQVPLPPTCGPAAQSFNVRLDDAGHSFIPPESGKAMVYFIHDDGSGVGGGSPTMRYAVDGSWAGANQGESWFAVVVAPGEHHLCATLQSSWLDEGAELTQLTAEPGKSYFFRTRIFTSRTTGLLEFEPVDSDEAGYLISLYPMATATVKK